MTRKWLNSQEVIAKMKREKLEMDYNSLQDQLNPHFLFNNLSVLKSLIIYNPEVAVGFTENFTDVYRYVLQSKNKRLVKLNPEAAAHRASAEITFFYVNSTFCKNLTRLFLRQFTTFHNKHSFLS